MDNLPFQIRQKKKVYSLKDKLRGSGDIGIDIFKISTSDDFTYKLISLNSIGKLQGKEKRFKEVVKNISAYHKSESVPNLIYYNNYQIVLNWIEGVSFKKYFSSDIDYKKIAVFNAKNFVEVSHQPAKKVIDNMKSQINILRNLNIISESKCDKIEELLNNNSFIGSNRISSALCFADTAFKNYIFQDNDGEQLVYIDTFGISRREIGRVFVKQVFQVPVMYRKEYIEQFKKNLSIDLGSSLEFSFLYYLIARIYSNSTKQNWRNKNRRKSKLKKSLNDLDTFIKTTTNNQSFESWITDCN